MWGVLLTQIGTPEKPTVSEVRRFLRRFLSDPRVVDLPRILWLPLLYGIILPFRPFRSAKLYQKIWTPEGSPLKVYTLKLAQSLEEALQEKTGKEGKVVAGMHYGKPTIKQALESLFSHHPDSWVVLPLFPQYGSSTTASSLDFLGDALKSFSYHPPFSVISQYFDHPLYSQIWKEHIEEYWKENGKGDVLLFSFHGQPLRFTQKGDPYEYHCQETAKGIAQALGLSSDAWRIVYQSKFGKEPWLGPSLVDTLRSLPQEGITSVDVCCPGFAVDGLETLEEVAISGKALFLQRGGKTFHYIPCLNATGKHVRLLSEVVKPYLIDTLR